MPVSKSKSKIHPSIQVVSNKSIEKFNVRTPKLTETYEMNFELLDQTH